MERAIKTTSYVKIILIALILSTLNDYAGAVTVFRTENGQNLQQCIDKCMSGDTLIIKAGIYHVAGISIKKPIYIIGEKDAILDGRGKGQIITVQSDYVHISGLTLRNTPTSFISDNAAIELDRVKNCSIVNNVFEDNFFALYLAKAKNCLVEKNRITAHFERETNAGNGIHLWYCEHITVKDNFIHGQRDGIYFEFVRHSDIENNISEKNLRYGLHFMFSDTCRYAYNVFRYNGAGVAVMYTHFVDMHDNIFFHNWGPAAYGLLLKEITDSHIENNTFSQNTRAIHAESSSRIQIVNNTFEQNGWALKIMGNCLDNLVKNNAFIANTFDVATNTRNNFNTFTKNYWDRYKGYDLDHDGYGDIAHRPVTLFSYMVEHNAPSLILMRSFFVDLLNLAESIMPVLTPQTLIDAKPLMRRKL